MTITPRHAHRRLARQLAALEAISLVLPAAIHKARTDALNREHITPEITTRSKGSISDPTGTEATQRLDAIGDATDGPADWLDTIGVSIRLLRQFCGTHIGWDNETDDIPIIERHRCGAVTPRAIRDLDWYTAKNQRGHSPVTCQAEALYYVRDDGTISWHNHGLCAADYKSLRRHLVDQGVVPHGGDLDTWLTAA